MPAGKTYIKIASQTLGSAVSSVTFSNLPQNYTDLVAVIEGTATTSFGQVQMRFNGDTGTNYSTTYMWGTGSAAVSDRDSNISTGGSNVGFIGTGRGTTTINVQNYSNQSTYKTAIARSSVAGNRVSATANLWRSTAAVNAIRFNILGGDTFASTTTFTIYGIECAKSPYAEGGDKVYSTGTHWVHEFYYSGQFVPRQNLTADYLVVAGGGGAGGSYGGGGGAGGLRSTVTATGGGGSLESALSLTASTAYTVTIGAGGIGAIGDNQTLGIGRGSDGSNSVFSTITATGGGGGGQEQVGGGTGKTGGSGGGGGGGGSTGVNYSGGTRTASPVQGFNGGNGFGQGGVGPGGGGGGAGAVGANGATSTAGSGGAGATVAITGSSITYAGGGGGGVITGTAGSGGSGGGGAGSSTGNGTAGTTNTGGGGGGADNNFTGGNGGSGIVIVRYAI